ncbi:hypothetical protein PMAYCL1PPCAC_22199 [Pristionchus mayeri]|uniref:F-box domain-containing protein n=1 Tax=Pristionchus mayeri TaxID=1317129 RepID=A0AAN5I5A6_9BILA|nr:hypothetical protein PMAYCL1PPCAC_22199 [Pristionchus mayeri]
MSSPPYKKMCTSQIGDSSGSTCDCFTKSLAERVFKKEAVINSEDNLSNLPDDCLREVLQSCDHDDLDVVSCVSQRLYDMSKKSRKKSVKERWNMLRLVKNGPGHFLLHAESYEGICLCSFSDRSGNTDSLKTDKDDPYDDRMSNFDTNNDTNLSIRSIPTPCVVLNRMNFLMERYTFCDVEFNSILIDDAFMDHQLKNLWIIN